MFLIGTRTPQQLEMASGSRGIRTLPSTADGAPLAQKLPLCPPFRLRTNPQPVRRLALYRSLIRVAHYLVFIEKLFFSFSFLFN